MNKQYVTLDVKALDDDTEHGSFEAILSMPKVDRDNEVIDAYAFRPLPKSIPIFGDHVATIATTVGRGVPKYDADGTLKVKGTFDGDDYSQLVRSKVRSQSVNNMSVGFMPRNRSKSAGIKGKDGATHYPAGSLELLESSFVPIPSLREATVTMAKSLTDDLAEAGKLDTDTLTPDPEDRVTKAAEAAELLTQLAESVLAGMDSEDEPQVTASIEALAGAFPKDEG